MPNHCCNRLDVTGPKEDMLKFGEFIKAQGFTATPSEDEDSEETMFSFDWFVPMPEVLRSVHTGGTTIDGESVREWITDENGNNAKITDQTKHQWQTEFGATNWYEWACTNWGTKWGAYDLCDAYLGPDIYTVKFQTAWAPPFPVIQTASAKFPNLKFAISYAEQGAGYYGTTTFQHGDYLMEECDDHEGVSFYDNDAIEEAEEAMPEGEYIDNYDDFFNPEVKEFLEEKGIGAGG